MDVERVIEDREEMCSIVSKLVKIRIIRNKSGAMNCDGEIVGFECGSSSTNCLSKCHYRMILEDF